MGEYIKVLHVSQTLNSFFEIIEKSFYFNLND